MIIKDIFDKDIARPIQSVINVDEKDQNQIVELEEYVVTKEIEAKFQKFFWELAKSKDRPNDVEIGVWINGYYGSGKSHFLKILSYLIENKEINGKKAVDYIESKISDPTVIANIRLASQQPTDVIMFDVDPLAHAGSTGSPDTLVAVVLRAFNSYYGYSKEHFWLADMERDLDKRGMYEEYKNEYQKISGFKWLSDRHNAIARRGQIISTLVTLGQKEEDAKFWFTQTTSSHYMSVETFVKVVKDKIDETGKRIIFMIDEMGQFVGSDKSKLLNLQSIAERLRSDCNKKSWIIVTAQEDIESSTHKLERDEFSKIQARFPVRIFLTSTNVDEVIKKRLLAKKESHRDVLGLIYQENSSKLDTLIKFEGPTWNKYTSKEDFVATYPFIPYQFSLLQSVFTKLSEIGLAGQHQSRGERSMLAGFQSAAKRLLSNDTRSLVPFYEFYNPSVSEAIQTTTQVSIDNIKLRAGELNDPVIWQVYVILVLIKGIQNYPATLENIVTLMINHIDQSRLKLKEQVGNALDYLVKEIVVYKEDDQYHFLTNEEQDINRKIKHKQIEIGEVSRQIGKIIFEDFIKSKTYKYGESLFSYNKFVDNQSIGITSNEIGIKIITPYQKHTVESARMESLNNNNLVVLLSDDGKFVEEFEMELRIQSFLSENPGQARSESIHKIIESKKVEKVNRNKKGVQYLKDSIKKSKFFINGGTIEIPNADESKIFDSALGTLIKRVYTKIHYMDKIYSEDSIRQILLGNAIAEMTFAGEVNSLAKSEILNYIQEHNSTFTHYTIRNITDFFSKIPYGWREQDSRAIIAWLFVNNNIELAIDGKLLVKGEPQLESKLTNKAFTERTAVSIKIETKRELLEEVKNGISSIFSKHISDVEDDAIFTQLRSVIKKENDLVTEIMMYYTREPRYPGMSDIENLREIISTLYSKDEKLPLFNSFVGKIEELKVIYISFEDIKQFFQTNQKPIFDRGLALIKKYYDNKNLFDSDEIKGYIRIMDEIVHLPYPFNRIHELNDMCERVDSILYEEFKKRIDASLEYLNQEMAKIDNYDLEQIFKKLNDRGVSHITDRKRSAKDKFYYAEKRIRESDSLTKIEGEKSSLATFYSEFIGEINEAFSKYAIEGQSMVIIKKVKLSELTRDISKVKISSINDIDSFMYKFRERLLMEFEPNTEIELED